MSIFSLLVVLKIILFIVAIGSFIFFFFAICSIYTNLTTGVPWVKIPEENINKIFKEISLPKNSLIYDLGCGDGRVLFAAVRQGYKAKGFELSLYPYLKGLIGKTIIGSQVEIKRKDFFKENLSRADAIFIFLNGKALIKLSQKLKQELKPNTVVISYGFSLPNFLPEKIISTSPSLTYVYKV